LLNSGGIRSNNIIQAGKITKGDIIEMFPFDNKIITAKLKGKDIKSILETSSRLLPKLNPAFVQSKGLSYTIDLSAQPQEFTDNLAKITKEGNLVSDVKINGQALDYEKYYTVASNDFMLGGGDGFVQFKNAKDVNITNLLIYNSIIDFLKTHFSVNLWVYPDITVINAHSK
jgi:5'-nucleotidase / UDP-sugar diphosphatase